MKDVGDRNPRALVFVLIAVIVVLALVLLYAFVVQPSMNGYAVKLQNEGVAYTLSLILAQVQQNGYVEIPVSENQSLVLVPYSPPQDYSAALSG